MKPTILHGLVALVSLCHYSKAFHSVTTRVHHTRHTHKREDAVHKIMSPTAMHASLEQFAPQAVSLFQNMITPASILSGAIVPMAFASAVPIKSEDATENRRSWVLMRKVYNVAALLSLLSNLVAVMWSVIAVNQLTETSIAPAESVWHLLRRDFDLPWAGVNTHFLFGLMSFALCVAIRAFLQVGGGVLGQCVAGLAGGALLMMVSVMNRAVAHGAGDGVHRYGPNLLYLFGNYIYLLGAKATAKKDIGMLAVAGMVITGYSLFTGVRAMLEKD